MTLMKDDSLEIKRLQIRVDEIENAITGFAQVVGESSNETVAMLGGIQDRYLELESALKVAEARVKELEKCAKATLLFYHVGPWTVVQIGEWYNLTQTNEATTRNLCDMARKALSK